MSTTAISEAWVNLQIAQGNLVEDGTGCVAKVITAARELDQVSMCTNADDGWAVDTAKFEELTMKYVGRAPTWLLP